MRAAESPVPVSVLRATSNALRPADSLGRALSTAGLELRVRCLAQLDESLLGGSSPGWAGGMVGAEVDAWPPAWSTPPGGAP